MGIYDTMQYIKPDVSTICLGQAASIGAFLLAGGSKGKRSALPNSRIMIHQPMGGAEGQATDIKIQAEEILRMKKQLNSILAKNTGQTLRKIETDTERDNYLTTKDAKSYGIIDTILSKKKMNRIKKGQKPKVNLDPDQNTPDGGFKVTLRSLQKSRIILIYM